ncbi:MAG: Ig-like domain-containing protein [Gemmatimonadaceae bacterium]
MSKRFAFLVAFTLTACNRDGGVDPNAGVDTITLTAAASFVLVGDSVLFTARVIDGNGQPVTGAVVEWSSSNPAIASVSATGFVTARSAGTVTITARSGSASASATFEVDPNPCTAPTAFAAGEVRRIRGAAAFACAQVTAIATTQEYLHIVGNAREKQDDTLTYTYSLSGTSAISAGVAATYGLRDPREISALQGLQQSDDLEHRLRAYERAITSDALPNVQRRRAERIGSGASLAVQAAVRDVGDTVSIRVPNLQPGKNICRDFITIRAVVRAVSRRATMMEDITSPPGRLTTTDYQEIAREFDDVIFPTDTLWFGSPTDLNNDGRIGIVYTPEVNRLTPAQSTGIVGGFFFGGDLIRRSEYQTTNDCRNQTNEQEIFYLLAPDPQATINGNARTTAGVRQVTRGTIAHEFQHMINQSVRQYNPQVKSFETAWLN